MFYFFLISVMRPLRTCDYTPCCLSRVCAAPDLTLGEAFSHPFEWISWGENSLLTVPAGFCVFLNTSQLKNWTLYFGYSTNTSPETQFVSHNGFGNYQSWEIIFVMRVKCDVLPQPSYKPVCFYTLYFKKYLHVTHEFFFISLSEPSLCFVWDMRESTSQTDKSQVSSSVSASIIFTHASQPKSTYNVSVCVGNMVVSLLCSVHDWVSHEVCRSELSEWHLQ